MEKVTMKISTPTHKKLQLAKAHMDKKTFSEVIEELADRYLERLHSKGSK